MRTLCDRYLKYVLLVLPHFKNYNGQTFQNQLFLNFEVTNGKPWGLPNASYEKEDDYP